MKAKEFLSKDTSQFLGDTHFIRDYEELFGVEMTKEKFLEIARILSRKESGNVNNDSIVLEVSAEFVFKPKKNKDGKLKIRYETFCKLSDY